MALYLAIDAGGTKTECLLADDRRILARAFTGTVKLMRVSEEEASSRMHALLEGVAADAGVSLEQVTRTCFGLAGISSPAARTWARQIIPAMVAGEFLLCGDEEIALDAAFADGSGILVIAGTGSNVVGRCPTGNKFSAGGWGPILGDEGAGYWIGLEAIRTALRVQDRVGFKAEPTTLLREIEQHWGLDSIGELVTIANQRPGPDFAELAPVVARCAAHGDALAATVLERAGEELAEQVAVVFHKMTAACRMTAPDLGVAWTGSVLTHIAAVRQAMTGRLAVTLPAAKVRTKPVISLEGALWRARRG